MTTSVREENEPRPDMCGLLYVILFLLQVKMDERKQAERLFYSNAGAAMQADVVNEMLKSPINEVLTFTPGKLSSKI